MSDKAIRRLAVIPARGGSKRIPDKNIRDFCGKPMLGHILAAAEQSGLFETIHISSDSDSIRAAAARLGHSPDFPRPAELADDYTPLIPVLQWTAQEFIRRGRHFDEVWLLMACAPLVQAGHLQAMAERMAELGTSCEALMAVQPFPAPVQRGFLLGSDNRLRPVDPQEFGTRSQDLPVTFHDAGVIDIYRMPFLVEARDVVWAERFHGYKLPRWAAVDIDTEEDWRFAEALYRGLQGMNR